MDTYVQCLVFLFPSFFTMILYLSLIIFHFHHLLLLSLQRYFCNSNVTCFFTMCSFKVQYDLYGTSLSQNFNVEILLPVHSRFHHLPKCIDDYEGNLTGILAFLIDKYMLLTGLCTLNATQRFEFSKIWVFESEIGT